MKENDESFEGQKKSKRKKITTQPTGEKRMKRTKRQRQSSQQFALPQNIPISKSMQLMVHRSFQRQTSRILVQVPYRLFKIGTISQTTNIPVESDLIDIRIIKKDNDSISLQLKFLPLQQQQSKVIAVWGKVCWVASYEVSTKIIKQSMKTITNQWNQISKLKISDVRSDIFIVLNLKEKIQHISPFNGLINQGNTCYMNSYLQMLNHISQFRNLVFEGEVQDQNKFPATLQILFYRLGNDHRAVSAEHLVKSFGWSKKEAQIQQDAQQFSCLFFQALQRKLEEVCHQRTHLSMNELFQGKLLHYIECSNVEYRSSKEERFFDLQLNITDNLQHSLDEYVSQQILSGDNMYDTQIYGKQEARKGVKIEVVPPILMIQLKRFAFSPVTYQNQKIMSRFQYPKEINFSKWLLSGENQFYQLYAVLVHQGIKAQSGHYYVYLNIKDQWFKFNDQEVFQVNQRTVFQYNFGGHIDTMELDTREMEVKEKKILSSSTAYMLVYVKKQQKQLLLQKQTIFPAWLKQRDILKMQQKQVQKFMKNYYHHIQIVKWEEQFLHKDANQIGFIPKQMFSFAEAGKINKSQKVSQWLKQFNNKGIGAYLHITCYDKSSYECVINMQNKSCSFQQLIREAYNPIIMLMPIIVSPQSYLLVIKLHQIQQQEIKFTFSQVIDISKYARMNYLCTILNQKYQQQGYQIKFYIQEKKQLISLKPTDAFIPFPQSVRNCMIVIIVEKIQKATQSIETTEKWFFRQKNTVDLLMKSEDGKYQFLITVNQHKSISDLRKLMFQEHLKEDEHYASSENIVIKTKQKKTSKIYQEVENIKTIKDLLKAHEKEKIIIFHHSNLKINERISQLEIKVKYRFKNLQLTQPISIILKKESDSTFYERILLNQKIKSYVEEENGKDIRIMLMTKDSLMISDIIGKDGYVAGKGQIVPLLQKQKNMNVVVQSVEQLQQELYSIILYHLSLTNDRIGRPRCLFLDKDISLSALRSEILKILKDQTYNWGDKIYPLNPSKLYIFAYVKDIKKSIELKQMVEENEQKTIEQAFPKTKLIKVMIKHAYLTKAQNTMKLIVQ